MTDRLTEITARAAAATEGPWGTDTIETEDGRGKYWSSEVYSAAVAKRVCDMQNADVGCIAEEPDDDGVYRIDEDAAANAAFIANARTDIPYLLSELRTATERVAELERDLNKMRECANINITDDARATLRAEAAEKKLAEIAEIASNSDKRGWSDFDRIDRIAGATNA